MKPQVILLLLALSFSFSTLTAQDINLESFATGFNRPVDIKHANDSRLFIVEQDGIIKIVNDSGVANTTPFLDITSIVNSNGNEQGLLGLAFDPNYATNSRFYLNYIDSNGDTVIARYTTSSNPDVADAASAEILLTVPQPYSNHNGGSMDFGNDDFLYIAIGDGGSAGDPENRAQNLQTLVGKILRIDVSGTTGYSIPPSNPHVGNANALDEIWSYGLRNPWKISFDSDNGELWIGDVGQSNREEINNVTTTDSGYNFGWKCYEGNETFDTSGCPAVSTLTFPVNEYEYGGTPFRCSITGGYRYRGSIYPNLQGKYFFADYCSNEIGTLTQSGNTWTMAFTDPFSGNLSTFGEDVNQELYVAGLTNGTIFKIVDNTLSTDENELSLNFELYPNPANIFFRIEGTTNISELERLNIIALSGKTVLEVNLQTNNQDIDITGLSKGIYIAQIIAANKTSSYKKLVIN